MESSKEETVELAESVFKRCWDEFYGSYLPEFITTTCQGLYPSSGKANLMTEELDRSVFDTPAKNDILKLNPRPHHLVSYIDETELDLGDALIDPESQTAEVWEEASVPEPLPGYTAYTHVRQSVYVRGDLWVDEDGVEHRLFAKGEETTRGDRKRLREDRDRVQKGKIVNAETRGNLAYNQESLSFLPPETWDMAAENMEDYVESYHDIEAWRDSRVGWDNDGESDGRVLIHSL
ncbi:NAD(P)H-binding family protein [Ceratobasidium sp. AG-Ba]|nr:NAD(P)H-binding family protein [Ceratobasidium sp. AG-Ba]